MVVDSGKFSYLFVGKAPALIAHHHTEIMGEKMVAL